MRKLIVAVLVACAALVAVPQRADAAYCDKYFCIFITTNGTFLCTTDQWRCVKL